MGECSIQATICNRRGLHARAAAKVAKLAETLPVEVFVAFDGQTVSSLSIMGLMMLGAATGSVITISAVGDEAASAVESLAVLVRAGFDERD